MKKRAMREIYDTLRAIRTTLGEESAGLGSISVDVRTGLNSLVAIRDDLSALTRTEQRRNQFIAEVEAVQRKRLPDSFELQMVKNIANGARGVLLKLEWSGKDAGTGKPCCPICHAAKGGDHRGDCALYQVIGPPRLADTESDAT